MDTRSRIGLGLLLVCILIFSFMQYPASADELTVYAYRQDSFPGKREGMWAVRLGFNYPVFPSNLAASFAVTVDDESARFEVLDSDSGEKAKEPSRQFLIIPEKTSIKPATVSITIQKDLSDSSGRILLKNPFTYKFTTLDTIAVTNLAPFYKTRKNRGVGLRCSRWISTGDFAKAVKIVPAVPNISIQRENNSNFTVTGDFDEGRNYVLKVEPVTVDAGKAMFEAKEITFKGPGIHREITFNTEGSVVELKSRQLAALRLAGVSKIRCNMVRVSPYLVPEIAQAHKKHKHAKDLHIEKKTEVLRSLGSAGKLNPVFVSDDQHDSDAFVSPEAQDAIREFSLPLSFRKNPDRGGAWLVSVTDADGAFTGEAAKLIQITDMAISYKLSQNSLLAWVTSLHTGLPVPTAELLLTQSDGHVLFLGKTDPNGVLLVKRDQKFPAMSTGKEGASSLTLPIDFAKATWLVAATPTDSCALEVTSSRLSSSAVSQTKKLKEKPDFHTGQVFTERGVYRPGETVYFKFVSREYEKNSIVAPAGQKIRAEITNPLQEVVYSKELTLGEFGSCHDSFATKKFFPVGTYTVTVSYMPDEKKAEAERFTTTFMVQEFKKIRHFTTLSVKKAEKPDSSYIGLKREEELLLVEVKGQYYTGGPVKNGQVRWKATLVPVTNTVPGFDGYVFGNQDTDTQFLESGEATLDKDGKLQLTIPLDTRLLTGIYGIQVSATVLDIDGEPATEVETYNPKLPYLVGVANHPRQVQSGYSAPLKAIVVDNDGKKVPSGTVKAIIMRQSYYYVQKRDEHGNINSSYEQGWAKSQATDQQIVNGEATLQTQLFDSGAYLIELVYEQDGARFASRTYFNVGWQEDYEERERRRAEKVVPTSNEILVSMSKKEYRAGDPAVIQFSTPRPVKKSLITLEKGEILEYHVVDVSSGTGTYQFTVKEQFQPNVYVSVMAAAGRDGYPVYASQVDTDIPMVYFGYADISVRSAVQKLKLDIEPGVSELRGRPGEKKTLNFRVTEAGGKGIVTEMAVCVVDEAILALTRFQTPELSALTKFNLPLAVFSGDLRLNLMSQDLFKMLSTRPLTGGGMGLGEVNPSLRKDFRPVAYFNPAVVTDASGRATVEFTLPDTTTAYRVYAVVCDKTVGFVSGQRNMVVTKEFFIEPSLPRFLIPGDSVTFPISVNNKTKEKGEVDLQIKGSAELKTSLVEPRFRIEPLSGMVVKGTGQVLGGMEKGVVTTEGKFSGDQNTFFDAIEQTIPIHSRFLPVNAMKMGSFKTKAEIPASLPQALKTLGPDSLNPEDFRVRLSLSLTNWSRLAPGLKYLLAYPYGCIEQTSSGIIPLAGIRGLIQSGTIPGISVEKVDKFLQSGIERLLSMQLASGGFSYWPGETDVSWWGTQYATYALVTARDAGFTVPPDRLEKAFKFIRDQVFSTSPENGTRIPKPAWTQELALLNISESDLLGPQDLDQFFKRFHSLKNQDKAFLLIAAKKVGYSTPQKLAEMFGTLDPKPDLSRTNYYDSTFRELAACLMAAVELRIAPQKADAWAGLLLTGLKPDGRWQSTADTGWCLLALSKYYGGQGAAKAKSETVPVRVSCGGRTVEAKLTDVSADVELDTREVLQNPSIRLESDGSRLVNYILYLTYPDVAKDPSELSRGFHLTKRIENLNGQDEIRVGDVLRVTLNISVEESLRKSGSILEYAALEDPVPAGIVPINPELKTEGVESEPSDKDDMFSYDGAQFRPNFSEFRDDGVRVFKNKIWPSTYTYSYLARAVAEGDFWMRGSRISLMYDPEYFGKTLGQRMKILPTAR